MEKKRTKQEYIKAWKSHIWEINGVALDSGHDMELALSIQNDLQSLSAKVEKVADILVDEGILILEQ